ncbi:alpha-2-macroglobulin family protein [Oesophagostomum dentatum]|uniref:Alpha-2-macroglobulin family protein n=1 Tax=Oesophagostomum dentatum TaxID=61180 RepID=A0A0B1TF49_OESDE|nr:alpha-2-macroglobulin family protein [Oesophagostomum dentatum]
MFVSSPFVVLPPSLRINAVNTIIVSPVKIRQDNTDLQIIVSGYNGSRSSVIFTQKLKAKRAGAPHSFSFEVTNPVEKAKVEINVQGHEKFESELRVKPNLAVLHIHTDKPIYSAGETVSVRALPLTHSGAIYDDVIQFALVNPDGFELIRKENKTSNGYIELTFELPKYLFYGEWHILGKPYGVNEPELTFDAAFQVKDYVLPPFKISMFIADGQLLNSTDVTVEARYYYGAPLSGSMTLYCSSRKYRSDSSKPKRLLQSEVCCLSVRALPLTHSGAIYDDVIQFALVNPDGFELIRKENKTSNGYIELTFELPKYLFYGEWHILGKPYGVNEPELTFDAAFQVKDYENLESRVYEGQDFHAGHSIYPY